jgi:hypothetical protein
MTKVHFSKISRRQTVLGEETRTGTLCNRMTGSGDINASQFRTDVTCKFCLRLLNLQEIAA